MAYWLFKSEPNTYSYDDLVRDGTAEWDGVRNFQARNFLRDEIKEGDGVLFYYSNAKPLVIVGTAVVTRGGYPDSTAWGPDSDHPDPRAHQTSRCGTWSISRRTSGSPTADGGPHAGRTGTRGDAGAEARDAALRPAGKAGGVGPGGEAG